MRGIVKVYPWYVTRWDVDRAWDVWCDGACVTLAVALTAGPATAASSRLAAHQAGASARRRPPFRAYLLKCMMNPPRANRIHPFSGGPQFFAPCGCQMVIHGHSSSTRWSLMAEFPDD